MQPWNEGRGLHLARPDLAKQMYVSSRQQNRLWDDRLRLISQCATASENISTLTDDIKSSTALLNNATFRTSASIENDKNEDNQDGHDTAHQTLPHLTREQNALVARLEAEKTRYVDLRARLVEVRVVGEVIEGGLSEGEKRGDGLGHQEREEEKGAEKTQGAKFSKEEQSDQQEQCHTEHIQSQTTRLGDKVAMMKCVLREMRQIASNRAAQGCVTTGYASPASKSEPKHSLDNSQEQSSISPSIFCASSDSRHGTPIFKQELALRVELERCVHQVSEINLDADVADIHNDILEVALDEIRTEHAKTAQARDESDAAKQVETHSEAAEAFAQLTQQTINLDMQVGNMTGTLTGLVLHVDDLEEMVEEEKRRRDEARARVGQMKANLKSYAALQTQNAITISALRAMLGRDDYSQQCTPPSPALTPRTRPSTITTSSTFLRSVYPVSQDLARSIVNTMADTTANTMRPLLEYTRSKVASIVKQTRSAMLLVLDTRMAKTLDAVEELVIMSLSSSFTPHVEIHAHGKALAETFVQEERHDGNGAHAMIPLIATLSTSGPTPAGSTLAVSKPSPLSSHSPLPLPGPDSQPLPSPVSRASSVLSLRYTPPPEDVAPIEPSENFETHDGIEWDALSPLSPPTSESYFDYPQEDLGASLQMDTVTPLALSQYSVTSPTNLEEHPESSGSSILSPQPGCLFLTNSALEGVPIRLQPRDVNSRVCRPFAFVRIISDTSNTSKENPANDYTSSLKTTVEVRDCRAGRLGGKIHQFSLNALCYLPPTTKHQVVIYVAPGAGFDPAQKYYILQFDAQEDGQCVVRKEPKLKGPKRKAELMTFPTRLLAQVAPPMLVSRRASAPIPAVPESVSSYARDVPAIPAASDEGTKKLAIRVKPSVRVHASPKPGVHFDHPPPMWLIDPLFSGCRVQLKEQDGDGSVLELVSVDIATSTVEVEPLLSFAPRRSMPLKAVRHVIAYAPYQMVVAIAGELKGTIMKLGTYDKEECTLYAALDRHSHRVTHCNRTYKTAHLAVIFPPRK